MAEVPSTSALLAWDLGTTRLKAALFRPDGTLVAEASARNLEHTAGGRAWQDPDAWWRDAASITRTLLARPEAGAVQVAGVSLSGRGGGAIFLDAAGGVLAPSWSDRRHAEELRALAEWRRGGAFLPNYAMALLAKLHWLRAHEPATASSLAHALYAKDFLLHRLTGEAVTDPTSGPDAADWNSEALAHAEVDRAVLPRIALPWTLAGTVTRTAADATGLPEGTPVAVGGHDGICANVGAGAGAPGDYAITLGTNLVVRAITSQHPPDAYRFYGLPPDRHVIGGQAPRAGQAVDWFLDLAGVGEGDERIETFTNLDARAGALDPGAEGVRFLPYLGGQLAPEMRPGARGAFAGLRSDHRREHLYRAVLEGGAFAIRAIFEQLVDWCGEPRRLRFTGTGARSEVWRQLIVDALGRPVQVTDNLAEARGAATFLATALGYHPDVDTAAAAMVHPSGTTRPDARRHEAYAPLFAEWQALGKVLAPFDDAAALAAPP